MMLAVGEPSHVSARFEKISERITFANRFCRLLNITGYTGCLIQPVVQDA